MLEKFGIILTRQVDHKERISILTEYRSPSVREHRREVETHRTAVAYILAASRKDTNATHELLAHSTKEELREIIADLATWVAKGLTGKDLQVLQEYYRWTAYAQRIRREV